jgi:uncharacterized protein (DUF885 family)
LTEDVIATASLVAIRVGRWVTAFAVIAVTALAPPADAQRADDVAALRQVFDEYWNWTKREFPEYATFVGDDRYNDRLTDLSPEAIARRKAYARALLERLEKFDASRLPAQDGVSLGILRTQLDTRIRLNAFPVERLQISQTSGPQIDLAFLVKSTPFRNGADYDAYLKRLHALPDHLRQIEALMRQGVSSRWVYPAVAIQRVPGQIDAWLTADSAQNPAYRPFTEFPREMGDVERTRLREAGRRAVADDVVVAGVRAEAVRREGLPAECAHGTRRRHAAGRRGILRRVDRAADDHPAHCARNPRHRIAGGGADRRRDGCGRAEDRLRRHAHRILRLAARRAAVLFRARRRDAGRLPRSR